ncbi:hypothetical protein ACFPRL_28610 [Pseudoclavibacter helvolus]
MRAGCLSQAGSDRRAETQGPGALEHRSPGAQEPRNAGTQRRNNRVTHTPRRNRVVPTGRASAQAAVLATRHRRTSRSPSRR